MQSGVAQGGPVSPVLFSLYVNDMPTPFHHVKLALYAADMVLVATSCNPVLLVSYLQSYLGYGIGGLISTSQRAPQYSSLRL
jgi:hypothetical protein